MLCTAPHLIAMSLSLRVNSHGVNERCLNFWIFTSALAINVSLMSRHNMWLKLLPEDLMEPSRRLALIEDRVSCTLMAAIAELDRNTLKFQTAVHQWIREKSHPHLNSVKKLNKSIKSCPMITWSFIWTATFSRIFYI